MTVSGGYTAYTVGGGYTSGTFLFILVGFKVKIRFRVVLDLSNC